MASKMEARMLSNYYGQKINFSLQVLQGINTVFLIGFTLRFWNIYLGKI